MVLREERHVAGIRENVRKIALQADTLEMWEDNTIEYFKSHKDEYDVVMTRSMPPESHMIGLKIKEIKPEIKWIASFGDPIANNPFVLKGMRKISPYSLRTDMFVPWGSERLCRKRVLKNMLWKRRNKKVKTSTLRKNGVWKRRSSQNVITSS